MKEEPVELIQFLAPYPEPVRQVMLEGSEFLRELLSPVTELHFDATQVVGAGFCYTKKWPDNFVNLAAYPRYVTLFFSQGTSLTDPETRLLGEGKRIRSIRLTEGMKTLTDPYTIELVRQAQAMAKRDPDFTPDRIIVVYNGPKRRPKPTD